MKSFRASNWGKGEKRKKEREREEKKKRFLSRDNIAHFSFMSMMRVFPVSREFVTFPRLLFWRLHTGRHPPHPSSRDPPPPPLLQSASSAGSGGDGGGLSRLLGGSCMEDGARCYGVSAGIERVWQSSDVFRWRVVGLWSSAAVSRHLFLREGSVGQKSRALRCRGDMKSLANLLMTTVPTNVRRRRTNYWSSSSWVHFSKSLTAAMSRSVPSEFRGGESC